MSHTAPPQKGSRRIGHRIWAFWSDMQWLIMAVVLALAVMAALYAYGKINGVGPLDRTLYEAAQLFGLNASSDTDAHVAGFTRFALGFARTAAIFILVFGIWKTLAVLFRDQWHRLKIRLLHQGHVIVCGSGEKGRLIARRFLSEGTGGGNRVVMVEKDEESVYLGELRSAGAAVLIGSALDPVGLRRAGIAKASLVVCVASDDETNLKVAQAVRGEAQLDGNLTIRIRVHVEDRSLLGLLRDKAAEVSEPGSERAQVTPCDIEYFNMYESGAVALLTQYPPVITPEELTRADGDAAPHILVVGVGSFGENVASLAARWWWGASHGNSKLRVTLVGRDAETRKAKVLGLDPWLEEYARFEAVSVDTYSEEFLKRLPAGDIAAAYVCHDHSAQALYAARLLERHPGLERARIVARIGLPQELLPVHRVIPFALLPEVCRPNIVIHVLDELLAQVIHMGYLRRQTAKGETLATNSSLIPDWNALPENMRNSNRAQAADIDRKLRKVGCRKVPLSRGGAPFHFTPEEVELLAPDEHERWMAERLAAGWTYGPTKDPVAKTNPTLIPWTALPEAEQNKDREVVEELPAQLTAAGYGIERLAQGDSDDSLADAQPAAVCN